MSDPLLILDGVHKSYVRGGERILVLQGVSLQVAAGELITVVAKTDHGKTTLLNVAAGIEPVERGSVKLDGRELSRLRDRELSDVLRTQIGIATRNGPLVPFNVRDYVGAQLAAGLRLSRQERELRVAQALKRLGVEDCGSLRWNELSESRRVRVELAQAVAAGPRLVLIDDLLDGLSPWRLQETMHALRELADEGGFGVLMAASDYNAAGLSDQVWDLRHGKLSIMADHTEPSARVTLLDPRLRRHAAS